MNKTTNKTTTHKDSLVRADLPLEDHELDSVSGGTAVENQEQFKALETFGKALQKAGQI